jgi:hypothetical protein
VLEKRWKEKNEQHPWQESPFKPQPQGGPKERELNFYEPGRRMQYDPGQPLPNDDSIQMMDFYYGMNNDLHLSRNPIIGEYIHNMMGFEGEYDHNKPGWYSWQETYKGMYSQKQQDEGKIEGWQKSENDIFTHPETGKALTGTKEISRLVRDGIFTHGGTLVFEGMNVYWGNVFGGGYLSDTAEEAIALMPYFAAHPGESTVPFGAGKLVFTWGGKPTAPTRSHFHKNWNFASVEVVNKDGELEKVPTYHKHDNTLAEPQPEWDTDFGSSVKKKRTMKDFVPGYDHEKLVNKWNTEQAKIQGLKEMYDKTPGVQDPQNIYYKFPKGKWGSSF